MQGEQQPPSLPSLSFIFLSLLLDRPTLSHIIIPTALLTTEKNSLFFSLSLSCLHPSTSPPVICPCPPPPSLRVTPHCPLASLYYFWLPSGLVRLVLRGSRQLVL